MFSQYQRAVLQLLDIPLWQSSSCDPSHSVAPHPILDDIHLLLQMNGSHTEVTSLQLGSALTWQSGVLTLAVAPEQMTAQDKKDLWQWLQTQGLG